MSKENTYYYLESQIPKTEKTVLYAKHNVVHKKLKQNSALEFKRYNFKLLTKESNELKLMANIYLILDMLKVQWVFQSPE